MIIVVYYQYYQDYKNEEKRMKITNRGRYALRATVALAQLEKAGENGEPIPISALAEQERISPIFLEQIFFRLRKAGIVASVRGPGGGFYFERPLDKITLKDILAASGEELKTASCEKHVESCARIGSCLSHKVWNNVNKLVDNFFMNITLASILEGGMNGEEKGEKNETESQ
jgi:Rrf2 family iron-sulfur cluster assembly transcriptional regulator